jgi:uridine kinase
MSDEQLSTLLASISSKRITAPPDRSVLIGISGIDASGKGYVSAKLEAGLKRHGMRTALINIDGWLNLPDVRFSDSDPGRHFYDNALRLDEMFEQLILPLKTDRSIRLSADLAEETATEYHRFEYVFDDVDVILLEGIFLFKRRYLKYFDLKVWIDCSFETALERAVIRSQEGLDPESTIRSYEKTYFPAQRLHFAIDHPLAVADLVYDNG